MLAFLFVFCYNTLILIEECTEQNSCRKNEGKQQIVPMPRFLTVYKPLRKKYLDAISQRHSRCQEIVESNLPAFHLPLFLHVSSCYIECQRKNKHGNSKMVWHNGRQHYIGKGIEKE